MNLLDLLCPPVSAHPGLGGGLVPVTVSASVWWEWRAEWGLLGLLVCTAIVYFRLMQQAAQATGNPFSRRHAAIFGVGLAVMYIASASPIDRIGEEYLFSMHMVQHNILMYLLARLLLAGIPEWAMQYGYERFTAFRRLYDLLSQPVLACLSFNLVFTLWHIPFLYDWALQDRMVHNLEHLTMIGTALILWLPLWSPLRSQRLAYPMQLVYLMSQAIAQLPVFAYVTFSQMVLYPTYEMAPRLTGLSPLADQQLGGVLMKLTGMAVLFVTFIAIAMEWYNKDQAASKATSDAGALPVDEAGSLKQIQPQTS